MPACDARIPLVIALLAIVSPVLHAEPCPCDGDVNDDGVANVYDWICIQDCKAGDCSCCPDSCDINCDGVVDDEDAGDDPVNEESAWRCLFVGLPPETCCPGPTGACCDLTTGVCQDDVLEADCTGVDPIWSEGLLCSEVSCPAPPTGACCDLATGICEDDVIEVNCTGGDPVWSEGLACSQVSCPAPPNGACCYLGNGVCHDGVLEADCAGADHVWTAGVLCGDVECAVPPQDPCPCDGDVNDDGLVNVVDSACIQNCKGGDCSCCPVSCDINCDGFVDDRDAGDDPMNDDSVWHCLFVGSPPEICCAPTGACCDLSRGVCEDGVIEAECTGIDLEWSEGLSCTEVSCPLPPSGACCNLATGVCENFVPEGDCAGANFIWSEGLTCSQVSCPAPPAGACCYLGNGVCQDDVIEVDCAGADYVWTAESTCGEVDCQVPPQDPCPCDGDVNEDGAVNVVDWACIQNCKAGDCSCCPITCDINCDGVVDRHDAGDVDPRYEDTAFSCLFRGYPVEVCCPPDGTLYAGDDSPVPSTSAWSLIVATLLLVIAGTLAVRTRRRAYS